MKSTVTALVAALLTLGSVACSHKPKREEAPQQPAAASTTAPADTGTVSGAPSSLGAASSGRGH
jgi:hypothetical protein